MCRVFVVRAQLALTLTLGVGVVAASVVGAQEPTGPLLDPADAVWSVEAPERFGALFETSEGNFTIEVHRNWAPLGADRFYNLVRHAYYDDARFHRTVPGFIVQFGLAGSPQVTQTWQHQYIADDPVVSSNTRGRIAYAFTDPATRATQVYINTVDNSRLDAGGFAPFGEVVAGMDVVDRIYSGYGENSGGGVRRGDQSNIVAAGNHHLDREFPELTRLMGASIVRSSASPSAGIDTAQVTRWVESMMGPAQLPAAAVVIVDEMGPIYQSTFGTSGTAEMLTVDSRFYLGSTTKTMTALAVMQLVDAGIVALDTSVATYLPELRFSDPERGRRVTVEHLLRHSSGLPTMASFNRRVQKTGRIDHIALLADPGTETAYSNLNFQLLGALVERVSGLPYAEYMRSSVFGPAGMVNTTAVREEVDSDGLVQGHSYVFGWPIARDEPRYSPRLIPAGYVVSTPRDIGRYLQLYLGGADGRILSHEGIAAMGRPASQPDSSASGESGVGLAWGITELAGTKALTHSGMTPGFYSTLVVLPDEGLGVAVLISRNAGPFMDAPRELMDGVLRIATGQVEPSGTPTYFPWERVLRTVLVLLILYGFHRTGRWVRAWGKIGNPRALAHTPKILGRLVFDLALAATIPLWIIVGLAKLPIQAFFDFYPDLGVALLIFPALAIPAAVFRALATSERARHELHGPP